MPGVFLDEPDFYLPNELNNVYPILDDEKAIINIGSVGQPRDGDPRAAWAFYLPEESLVSYRRAAYDLAAKGARPRGYLMTLQLDDAIDEAWIARFAAGLAADQAEYGVALLGGDTTALAVLIETAPCHIASLPVAVNMECHSHRHKTAIL